MKSFASLILLLSALCSGCGSVIFRSDFNGVSYGPFSNGASGTYADYSAPNGDEVAGSNLTEETVRFTDSMYPADSPALMLAPNSIKELSSPIVEFRPIAAPTDDDTRTFFWSGRKFGSQVLDCTFTNWISGTTQQDLYTLRFANSSVSLIVYYASNNPFTLPLGSLPNGTTHNVWVRIKDKYAGGEVEISPHGGGSSFGRTEVALHADYSPDDVRVACGYPGLGDVANDNYVFDKMVFRSK